MIFLENWILLIFIFWLLNFGILKPEMIVKTYKSNSNLLNLPQNQKLIHDNSKSKRYNPVYCNGSFGKSSRNGTQGN